MSTFLVEAMDPISKQIGTIEVKAESEMEARTKVERGGYKVIELRHAGAAGAAVAEPFEPAPERSRPAPRPAPAREPESDWSAPPRRSRPRAAEPAEPADEGAATSRRWQGGPQAGPRAGAAPGGGSGSGAVVLSLLALLIALGALGTVLYFNFVKKPAGVWRSYDWSTPAAAAESAVQISKRVDVIAALEATANWVISSRSAMFDKIFRGGDPEKAASHRAMRESMRVVGVVPDGDARAYAVIEVRADKAEKPQRDVLALRRLAESSLWQAGELLPLRDIPDSDIRDKVSKLIDQAN